MANRAFVVRGTSIGLSDMMEKDQPLFRSWLANNEELRRLIDDSRIPTEEDQARWFDRCKQPDRRFFSILTTDGRLIGNCGLVDIDREAGTSVLRVTIGDSEALGKGYGTEAVSLLLWYAFHELPMHAVSLRVLLHNTRAIRAYEKAGFRPTGEAKSSGGEPELIMTIRAADFSSPLLS
ncbi:MAG: GNAT family protein [Candidatus Peribacteraceae bacterium]|jgi:RimJ/RimL family protein N-acetyltransferase